MFEELIDPLKIYLSKDISNFPIVNESKVIELYDGEVLKKIKDLKKEFFYCDAWKNYNYDNSKNIKTSFWNYCLGLYPFCNNEVIELFWWDYFFCMDRDGIVLAD